MKNLLLGLSLALLSAACAAQTFPVTVDSCGEALTFTAPPQRAVVHDLNMTEMALALQLQDRMVGVTGITGWYKTGPEFKAALGNIPELAPKYPTLENLLAANPDFFFAGWYYGMKPGGEVTPATLALHKIKTLVLSESCIHLHKPRPAASMDLLYGDFSKLGSIFGKAAEAQALVAQWKARLAKLDTAAAKDTRVFLYDSGEDKPFTAGKYAIPTAMIAATGARNIMADMETSWGTTDWETVAARNPQFLILLDYQDGNGPSKLMRFLQAHPAMKETDAVKNKRFVALRYAELTPGPANIDAIEKIAAALRSPSK
ncbi:iron complex transport system substrate-binding protein [Rhodoferax sp. OV413]|uniref:ABC transporter substrate-binding protein n=1 Tax=Rhodoferax sp. OV413 TaxID=1855285 RepID=UPI0008880B27|nr:ABC transporter substrate-binding protein [Rhodoferax sp. OV413]SDP78020.1 iron complex transport system substrate-binding protein [Rhodoferax sp. OV413]